MQIKIIVLCVLSAALFSGVLAHELNEDKKIPYRSAVDKFFIIGGINSQKGYVQNKDDFFDFFGYWLNKALKGNVKGKYKHKTEDFLAFLDYRLNELKVNSKKEKFRIVKLQLTDYHSYADILSGYAEHRHVNNRLAIDEKIKNDMIFLDNIFSVLDKDSKLLAYRILESEASVLTRNKDAKALIGDLSLCDELNSTLKYVCYDSIIREIIKGNPRHTKEIINAIKSKMLNSLITPLDCHFLNHEVGFFAAEKYGLGAMSRCLSTYDECTFGCYHGIGEYLFYKNAGNLDKPDFLNLNNNISSYEIFTLYHAIGHSIYRFWENVTEAKLKCGYITKGSPKKTGMCYSGMGHEFAVDNLVANISLEKASESCGQFEELKNECFYHLGSVYSHSSLNITLSACYSVGSYSCITGMGLFIDGAYFNDNLPKSIEMCNSLLKDDVFLIYCYRGILASSIYYHNNLTRAFEACLNVKRQKLPCLKSLKSLYSKLWFNESSSFCNFIEDSHKNRCYEETADI